MENALAAARNHNALSYIVSALPTGAHVVKNAHVLVATMILTMRPNVSMHDNLLKPAIHLPSLRTLIVNKSSLRRINTQEDAIVESLIARRNIVNVIKRGSRAASFATVANAKTMNSPVQHL